MLAVSCAQTIGIVFQPLLGVTEDLVGGLDGLELGVELGFLSWIPIRVVQECFVTG